MKDFIRNLAILAVLAIVVFLVFPDLMRQVFGLFNGLGILPLFILMVYSGSLATQITQKAMNRLNGREYETHTPC